MKDKYKIEYQFQEYIKRVGLSGMPEYQEKELRRAFFGAWGQFLVLMDKDLHEESEGEFVRVLENMVTQVTDFFLKESKTPQN